MNELFGSVIWIQGKAPRTGPHVQRREKSSYSKSTVKRFQLPTTTLECWSDRVWLESSRLTVGSFSSSHNQQVHYFVGTVPTSTGATSRIVPSSTGAAGTLGTPHTVATSKNTQGTMNTTRQKAKKEMACLG